MTNQTLLLVKSIFYLNLKQSLLEEEYDQKISMWSFVIKSITKFSTKTKNK